MARFMLFTGNWYYPEGGIRDFVESSHNLDELESAGKLSGYEWWHIYDTEASKIVRSQSDNTPTREN